MRLPLIFSPLLFLALLGCAQPTPVPVVTVLTATATATAAHTATPTAEVIAIITQAAIPSPTSPVPSPHSPTPIPQSTIPLPQSSPTPTPTPRFTQLTTADCCTNHEWLNEREIGFIDSDPSTRQVGLLALDVFADTPTPRLLSAQIGILSPNGRYLAYPDRNSGQAVFIDQQTGAQWMLNLQGNAPNFSPDSTQLLWTAVDLTLPPTERTPTYWLSQVDGSEARQVASVPRSSAVAWLGSQSLLIQRTVTSEDETTSLVFGRLSLFDGSLVDLWASPNRPRGFALNPSRTQLVYYTALNPDPADNGLWLVDLATAEPTPQKLPFLGSYRWRDDQRLLYIPFDGAATSHSIYQYDVATAESLLLLDPAQQPFLIANNNWSVSADGRALVFLASTGAGLDGLWLVELE
ncbi:MAG: hypothetical protein OT477_09955 [Chloroflexi bacterium]|nr:hypothetical protein [Chloroflexota bacterium]